MFQIAMCKFGNITHKNEAWDLVEFPARRKPIGSKWVFKKKMNVEDKVEK